MPRSKQEIKADMQQLLNEFASLHHGANDITIVTEWTIAGTAVKLDDNDEFFFLTNSEGLRPIHRMGILCTAIEADRAKIHRKYQ